MAEQTLVPAYISVTYCGTEINITDVKFSMKYNNNTRYEENMTPAGTKGYLLRKGISVEQEGQIYVIITKTPDNNNDASIKFIENKLKEVAKSEKPKEYIGPVVLMCKDPGEEKFLTFSFNGYVKEMKVCPSNICNGFIEYLVEFEIFDPLSVKFEN